MKKLFIALLIVAAWTSGSISRTYTAEQIANLTFDDVTRILRTIILPATVVQTNNRQYSLDMIFNLVYDSTNRALRISAVLGPSTPPDSLHEWAYAWIDTAYAKHYASKAGLALHFWMRGTRGDTLVKFSSKTNPVVIWFDTLGDAQFAGRVTSRADSTDTSTSSRFKFIGQSDSIPWCSPIDSWGAKGFITGWYPDSGGIVKPPANLGGDAKIYTGVALREKRFTGAPGPSVREIWSIRVGGYKSPADSIKERWRYLMAMVDPGSPNTTFSKTTKRIYWGTPFYWMKIDTVCTPDTVAWVDTSGQIHVRGVDLFPLASVPLDSHKVWASPETLWYNDKAGVPHGIWPSSGGPGGGSAFGDTDAYYASVASFGTGRDSVAGYYFSGTNSIQDAINAASAGATITNKKTVYLFEGTYAQNCSLKSNVNLVGAGMQVTVINTGKGNKIFTARGASNFTVRDLSLVADSAVAVYLLDSLTTAGCLNVLYYNFMCYSSPLIPGNDMIAGIKVQAGDSVKFINCQFGLGTRNSTATGPGWAAINVAIAGGMLTMDKVSQQTAGQVYGMTITKSAGIIDISNSSFVCVSGTPGIGVILAENQNYENWCDFFTNCDFTGSGGAPAFRNTGTGYLANIFLEGCTLWGTYTPSVGASQNNHVSGKIFRAGANPMTQLGWGGILSGTNAPELNLEWQGTGTGDMAGFHYGGIAFDTLLNVLSNAPSEGYMQYKENAAHDTLYLYADGSWHNVWPASGGGGSAFGDTSSYYVSVASFGTGRDSVGGFYFSGKRALQAAINQASVAGTKTNRKTVHMFPGYYVDEPCTLKPYVNLVGAGKTQTVIQYTAVDSTRFTCAGARYFSVQDIQVQSFNNSTVIPCSLVTESCTLAYFRGDLFTQNPGSGYTTKYVIKATGPINGGDSVLMEDVVFGDEPQQLDGGAPQGLRWGELYIWVGGTSSGTGSHVKMKHCNLFTQYGGTVNGTFHYAVTCTLGYQTNYSGIEFEDCNFTSTGNNMMNLYSNTFGHMSIRNCVFRATHNSYDTLMRINNDYGPIPIYMFNSSFTGRWWTRYSNGCALNFVNCALEANLTSSVFPLTDANTLQNMNGFFEWRDNTANRTWYYGAVHFDTTKTTVPATPRTGMTWYKSNASPNDTIYSYMNAGWRNLDRTWAAGVDSVLANGTSDTLAVTGIQTTSFVEVQLESDPGVNIGCPYHTKTANQDILIWPMACVNKFYYRWRIH